MEFKKFIKSSALKDKVKFVKRVLMQIFSVDDAFSESEAAQEDTVFLWRDKKFLSWLKSLGIQATPGKIPKYKDGGVGRAYFMDDMAIKLTDNAVEANVANMLIGNKDAPARIHGVYKVPNSQVYAIASDKYVVDMPKTLGHASDLLMTYLDDVGIDEYPMSDEQRMELAKNVVKKFGEPNYMVPYVKEIIESLFRLYKATGFFHDDAMPQNLAMSPKGEIMVVDLGPNQPKDFDPQKKLADIQAKREKLGLDKMDFI